MAAGPPCESRSATLQVVRHHVDQTPNRAAVLSIGGDKTAEKRWYEIFVPIADRLYDEHLTDLEK